MLLTNVYTYLLSRFQARPISRKLEVQLVQRIFALEVNQTANVIEDHLLDAYCYESACKRIQNNNALNHIISTHKSVNIVLSVHRK